MLATTPAPPLDKIADPTWQWVVFAGAGAAFLALAVLGALHWRRGGTPVLLVGLVGGAVATLMEPMYDLVTRLYMYERGAHTLFTVGGRGMQLWAPLGYGVYIGACGFVFHRLTRDPDTTRRAFWRAVVIIMCLNLAIELPATRMGLYEYYGPQAFDPTGFPLYWLFSNIAGAAAAGVLFAKVPQLLRGARVLGAPALVASCFIAGEVFIQWPAFAGVGAKNSNEVLTYLGALGSIAIGVVVLRALAAIVAPDGAQALDVSAARASAAPRPSRPSTSGSDGVAATPAVR